MSFIISIKYMQLFGLYWSPEISVGQQVTGTFLQNELSYVKLIDRGVTGGEEYVHTLDCSVKR